MKALWSLALCLFGCGEVASSPGSASHRPGDPCLSCHSIGGSAEPTLSVAGTVIRTSVSARSEGVSGVTIAVVDASGRSLELVTDDAGNFYTDEPVSAPLRASIDSQAATIHMPVDAPSANCNTCHRSPGANARALGWIRPQRETGPDMRPGADCLSCHAPPLVGDFDPAPHFGAAGTIAGGAGAVVIIQDSLGKRVELSPTSSGNFWTTEALIPPLEATISRGGAMLVKAAAVDSGSCNGCHDGANVEALAGP